MPIFLDRHDLRGLTAADIAEAHRKDLEVQDRYGVRFLTYWFDEARGSGFCLVDAPDIETAMRVHDEAHGDVAKDVIEVDLSAVEAFLGRVSDPPSGGSDAKVSIDSALRAIMFTDIVDSTGMTARLGDARAVEMVRAHDAMVRRALKDKRGREVKHTGDGIMASFDDTNAAVQCARAIQQAFDAFSLDHLTEPFQAPEADEVLGLDPGPSGAARDVGCSRCRAGRCGARCPWRAGRGGSGRRHSLCRREACGVACAVGRVAVERGARRR